ncbi:phospholipid phosphatase-related protein type 4-like isoform X1 [Salvelinus alpinus]|uniref:phospholipid phosphatase-related protein type 4-like isoform X1 n=2 Tax=Salvelinus alpinus TaxID=8036 RepID=UPI0039FB9A91
MSAKERLKGKVTKDSVTLLPCFYFVELPILASSVVSLYFLELTDVFKPVRSGYSCNDRSLSMPYIEPAQEAIPFLILFSLAFAGPAATIMIGEGILYCCLSRKKNGVKTEANINAAGCNFNSYIRRAVRFVGVHVFGLCITALITDIIQLSTGYHAPYFLTVCKPNYTTLNMTCDDSSFIIEDICSDGADPAVINSGRKSFPSQHATLAAFAAVYISMYFNATLTESSKLLKPLLVFSFIMGGIICGLTRIIQFKNHAIDVYCGFLIGGGIAVYLGLYAVGNFQPSEDTSRQQPQPPPLREPPRSNTVPNVSQNAGRHLQLNSLNSMNSLNSVSAADGLTAAHPETILTRVPSCRESSSLNNLKRASADLECITPPSPMGKQDCLVTFNSSTLPRSHGGSLPEEHRVPRRHASIHSSMDSTRSKQLLSQWKSKNENRKLSLQVMDSGVVVGRHHSTSSSSSPQRTMELRCSSEPSAMGLEAEFRAQGHIPAQYMKLAASTVPLSNHLPHNGGSSGLAGGARVSIQSRPGSSQLVHIPEETQEHVNSGTSSREDEDDDDREDNYGGGGIPCGGGSVRSKWLKDGAPCRTNSLTNQPRIMQVITMSKQQGLLQHGSPKSSEDGSVVSCTGSIQYKALMDQEPGQGIVRVEAHPENKPVIKPPDGSGSWRWKPQEQRGSIRQAFELNDLNRDSESCDSLKDGYGSFDGRRSQTGTDTGSERGSGGGGGGHPHVHHPHYHHHHHPHQGITTIRVTPVEGLGGGSEAASETLSIASSRESTLRRKGNIILLPDRGQSPDNSRNYFKGTSPTPPPTLGLAYRE